MNLTSPSAPAGYRRGVRPRQFSSNHVIDMGVQGLTPILNVSNLEDSFEWFRKFGWEKRWEYGDPPDFGAVGNGRYEIFLCNDCQGGRDAHSKAHANNWNTNGAWMSMWVRPAAAVDAVHEAAMREGLLITCPPTDMPWNVRECHIQHPDGHVFRVSCQIEEER